MASFSPAPMIAASMAASRLNARRGGSGGGGGEPPRKDDDKFSRWAIWVIIASVTVLIALVVLRTVFTKEGVTYVVDGALVDYQVRRSGKTDKVFVRLLQTDGKIREYESAYAPNECHEHIQGIGYQVLVTPYHNAIFNITDYRSHLLVDPCAK